MISKILKTSLDSTLVDVITTVQTLSSDWETGGDVELSTQRTIVDTNFNATSGYFYLVNTTNSPITATLPSNPSIGYNLFFKDPFLTWKTNNFTLNNNTNMIQGLNEFIVCDIDGLGFNLTYIGSTVGWRIE